MFPQEARFWDPWPQIVHGQELNCPMFLTGGNQRDRLKIFEQIRFWSWWITPPQISLQLIQITHEKYSGLWLIRLQISIWVLTENSQQAFAIFWKRRPGLKSRKRRRRHGFKSRERRCRYGRWVDDCTLLEPVEFYLSSSSEDINLWSVHANHVNIGILLDLSTSILHRWLRIQIVDIQLDQRHFVA